MAATYPSPRKAVFAARRIDNEMSEPTAEMMQEPWYRNPWVWLVIAIPSLTVAGCMLTIYLALSNPHILVGNDLPENPAPTGSNHTGTK